MNNEVSNLYSICAFLHSVQVAVDTKGSNPDWTKPKPVPDWAATLQFWKQPFLWYQCSLFLIELYFYFFDNWCRPCCCRCCRRWRTRTRPRRRSRHCAPSWRSCPAPPPIRGEHCGHVTRWPIPAHLDILGVVEGEAGVGLPGLGLGARHLAVVPEHVPRHVGAVRLVHYQPVYAIVVGLVKRARNEP